MWGAPKYLVDKFDISLTEAKSILQEWMRSFKI